MRPVPPCLIATLALAACSDPPCRPAEIKVGMICYAKPDSGAEDAEKAEGDSGSLSRVLDASLDAETPGTEAAAAFTDSGSAPSVREDSGSCLPSAEACNGMDDDCDGTTDEGTTTRCWADADGDGYAALAAPSTESCDACGALLTLVEPQAGKVDCDDSTPTKSPGATDVCGDAVDNDCNGVPDDAMRNACGGPCTLQLPGKPGDPCSNGQKGACARIGTYSCNPDYSLACSAAMVQPAASELCGDGSDNDCDGATDEDCVRNKCGGWSALAHAIGDACAVAVGTCSYPGAYQCDATNTEATLCTGSPPAENCGDGIDNDCKNGVDDGCGPPIVNWYPDCDGDGFAKSISGAVPSAAEPPPVTDCLGWTLLKPNEAAHINWDCSDRGGEYAAYSALYHPGADFSNPENWADGWDFDCDGINTLGPKQARARPADCPSSLIDYYNANGSCTGQLPVGQCAAYFTPGNKMTNVPPTSCPDSPVIVSVSALWDGSSGPCTVGTPDPVRNRYTCK